jgi:Co/Zn/Cd efflux system component
MHTDHLSNWSHDHAFNPGNPNAGRGTRLMMCIAATMRVVEILAGWHFYSMALRADGWHMRLRAVAIGLSAFTHAAAQRYPSD